MDTIEQVLSRIGQKMKILMPQDGNLTLSSHISCFKASVSNDLSCPTFYDPTIIFLINGHKESQIGSKKVAYHQGQFFISTIAVPAEFKVLDATPDNPHMAIMMKIDGAMFEKLISKVNYELDEHSCKDVEFLSNAYIKAPACIEDLRVLELMIDNKLANIEDEFSYHNLMRLILCNLLSCHDIAPLIVHYVLRRNAPIISALDYIAKHYDREILVSDLAKQCALSENRFYHCFKSVTSTSPLQYIKRKRLLEARNFLMSGKYKANVVASMVGYASESHFSNDYVRFFGQSPKQVLNPNLP